MRIPVALAALSVVACGASPVPRAAPCDPKLATSPTERAASPTNADAIEVAVTVDDLPHHGEDVGGASRLSIHQRFVAAFAAHRLPPVVGFVNARTLEQHPEEDAALAAWVAGGHLLANHTYGHVDAATVDATTFLAEVDANEAVLRRHMGERAPSSWRFFRFPYLREGRDASSQERLRKAVRARGYRLAEVTVDTWDWAYALAAARCRARGDENALAALREDFVDAAAHELRWADGAAREMFRRPVKQVLLLHVSDFTASMMDTLLATYEKMGARFVTLEDALSDPLYADEATATANQRGNLLWRARKVRGTRTPAVAPPRDTLLEHVCR